MREEAQKIRANGKTAQQAITEKIIERAIAGDIQFTALYLERTEGKVKDLLEIARSSPLAHLTIAEVAAIALNGDKAQK